MANRQGHEKKPSNLFYPEFLVVFLIKHRKQVILYLKKAEIENTLPSYEIRNLECSWKNIDLITYFRFSPQYYLIYVTQPTLKRNVYGEGHILYFIKYLSSLHRCSIVASICILKQAACRNFHAQVGSSQSEERTMFFTLENNETSNQNRERRSFTWEKNDRCNQKASDRSVRVSRQNFRLL